MKMVEEMYKVQQEIIEGVDKAGSSNGSTLTIGLRKLIQHLMRENQQLTKRLQKSEDRYNEQRDQADSLLRLVYTRQNRQVRLCVSFPFCYIIMSSIHSCLANSR